MVTLKLLLDSLSIQYEIADDLLEKKFIAFSPIERKVKSEKKQLLLLTDNILLTEDSNDVVYVAKEREGSEGNISLIISDLSVEELCDFLAEATNDYLIWFEQLLAVFQHNGDILQLISIINMKIKNPVIIFDTSYKLLGYSAFFNIDNDPEWGSNILKGYVVLSEKRNKKLQEVLLDNHLVERGNIYQLNEFENRFFCKSIRYNREVIGMFTIIEQKEEINSFSIDLIQSIFFIVEALAFLKQSKTYSSMKAYEYLLKDLIADSKISSEEVRERLYFEKYILQPPFAVCTILVKAMADYSLPTMFYLNSNINFMYSEYHVFLLENYSDELLDSLKREVKLYLKNNKTIAGISEPFDSIMAFKEKYQDSIKAIQFNRYSEKYALYCYKDNILDDFFNIVSMIHGIEKFLYPPAINLMKKDKILYKTLVTYIEQKNSQKSTSILLEIHRTTLVYRLNKIREEYGIDSDDPNIALQTIITAKLLECENIVV